MDEQVPNDNHIALESLPHIFKQLIEGMKFIHNKFRIIINLQMHAIQTRVALSDHVSALKAEIEKLKTEHQKEVSASRNKIGKLEEENARLRQLLAGKEVEGGGQKIKMAQTLEEAHQLNNEDTSSILFVAELQAPLPDEPGTY